MSDEFQRRTPAIIRRSTTVDSGAKGDDERGRGFALPGRSQGALRSFSTGHGWGQIREVDTLRPEMRQAALNDRYYGREQLPDTSSNSRPPTFAPLLPRPNHRPHIHTSTAGPPSEPSLRTNPTGHGLVPINEEIDSLGLQMQSTVISYGFNDPGQLSGNSSFLRPDGPHYQPTFPSPNPRPTMRSMAFAPYSAPPYTHAASSQFPNAVTFPQPPRSEMTDADASHSFEGPFSPTPSVLNPMNTHGHSNGNAHQNVMNTHHDLANTHQYIADTHQMPNNALQVYSRPYQDHERQPPVPLQSSHSMPMPTGTPSRRESGFFVFGAPMERDQTAFDGSGYAVGQRQWNPVPEYPHPNHPRYQTVETYDPIFRQQTQQIAYGAHQMHTRGATADQGPQGEPGAYDLRSAYNQETGPVQSSPESLRFPQDIERVPEAADHNDSTHTRDCEQTTKLIQESPQSAQDLLKVLDPVESEINEEAADPSERGMLCPYLLSQLVVLFLHKIVQKNAHLTSLPSRSWSIRTKVNAPVDVVVLSDALKRCRMLDDILGGIDDIPDEFGNTSGMSLKLLFFSFLTPPALDAEKALYKLMKKLASINLSDKLSLSSASVAGGGQADIFRSKLKDGREVAVKIFRFDMRDNMRLTKVCQIFLFIKSNDNIIYRELLENYEFAQRSITKTFYRSSGLSNSVAAFVPDLLPLGWMQAT